MGKSVLIQSKESKLRNKRAVHYVENEYNEVHSF